MCNLPLLLYANAQRYFAGQDEVDAPHMQWLDMANKQTDGVWGTWTKESLLAHTLLPHGLILNFGLCQISSGNCKTALVHDNGADDAITASTQAILLRSVKRRISQAPDQSRVW